MTETMEATREPAPEKKERSRFRFRRGDKKRKKQSEKSESRQTAQVAKEAPKAVTRDGVPVVTASNADGFQPSDVHQTVPANKAHARGRPYAAERIVLDAPPAAKDAAFAGPPRYDWIDIETAAAVKVQSAHRRNQVMSELEAQGLTTAAIRNRRRRRAARSGAVASGDAPGLFQCCGVGLIFGDATTEDVEASQEYERERYEERKRDKAQKEALLRQYHPRAKTETKYNEGIEVIE